MYHLLTYAISFFIGWEPEKHENLNQYFFERSCADLLFGKTFAEKCMKIKEIGLREGGSVPAPLGSASGVYEIIFSRAPAKAERDLSSLPGVFLCVELGDPPTLPHPPGNGISTGNFLISSLDLDSPTQFSLEWYSF